MTTDRYLKQIEMYDAIIENKIKELDNIEEKFSLIPSTKYEERVQSSPDLDKMGRQLTRLIDYKTEVEKYINELSDKRKVIVNQIEEICFTNKDYYNVLFNIYVLHNSLIKTSKEVFYSYKQTSRIYKSAIGEFENKYGDLYLCVS